MKMRLLLLMPVLGLASLLHANSEISQAVSASFGQAVAREVLLLKGTGTTAEPVEWSVYARDAFRADAQLRMTVKMEGGQWKALAAGAGERILSPAPPRSLEFARLHVRSAEARQTAARAAALAQITFVSVDYQLAANAVTGAPEWGLALKDETGHECGFCVVSGESGALIFQDWTPRFTGTVPPEAEGEGERAAKAVKKAARKAWNWTDRARTETKGFFRELFR
jgi:hypothetical protein